MSCKTGCKNRKGEDKKKDLKKVQKNSQLDNSNSSQSKMQSNCDKIDKKSYQDQYQELLLKNKKKRFSKGQWPIILDTHKIRLNYDLNKKMGTYADPIFNLNRMKILKDPFKLVGQQERRQINPEFELSEAQQDFRKMSGLNNFCRIFDPEKQAKINLCKLKHALH